jgi:hypothetical protein
MKRFNISKPRKYTGKDGVEKTYWDKVGEMVEFDNGNIIVKIPAISLEANVFEDKPKDNNLTSAGTPVPFPEEDKVNPDDIPDDDIPF